MSFVKDQSSEKLTQLVQQTMTITIPSFEGKVDQAQSHYVTLMPIPIMTTILAGCAAYLVEQVWSKAPKMFKFGPVWLKPKC